MIRRQQPQADECVACERTVNYLDAGFAPSQLGHRCACGGMFRPLVWYAEADGGEYSYSATRAQARRWVREVQPGSP